MRLKSYTAKTTKDAMQMVREELGEDAIIVATHEEKNAVGGRQVRITAAVEKDGFHTGGPIEDYADDYSPNNLPNENWLYDCLLYTSPSPRDRQKSRMPSSA